MEARLLQNVACGEELDSQMGAFPFLFVKRVKRVFIKTILCTPADTLLV